MWQYIVGKSIQTTAKIYGQIESDEKARNAAAYQSGILQNNAIMADWDAYNAIQSGVFNIKQFKKNFEKMQGSARVAAASSGVVVNEGSALDVLVSNAGQSAVEETMMRYESEAAAHAKYVEAHNYRQQAALIKASAPSGFSTAISVLGIAAGGIADAYGSGAMGGAGGAAGGGGAGGGAGG